MKTDKTIKVNTCDFCGKEETYHKCLSCGKDICYNCKEKEAVEFNHALFFKGSDDGLYCNKCIIKLENNNDNSDIKKQYIAYKRMSLLIKEYESVNKRLEHTANDIEQEIKYWNNKLRNNK